MYVVIMGCGRLGAQLAELLSLKEHDVVVIDHNPSAFEKLGSGFNGVTVVGTGIDIDVQKKAGVDRCDAFAALSSEDNTNIMAAQVAKEIFAVPKVIARIFDPKREFAYHQLGLESICPTNLGAEIVQNYLESDKICCRHSYGDLDVIEFAAPKAMAGKQAAEIEEPGAVRLVGICRTGTQQIITPETVINEGDTVLAAVKHSYRQHFRQTWLKRNG